MRRAGPVAALLVAVAILFAGGCSAAGERPPPAEDPQRPIITVTSFPFPESETLAEVYGQALRRQHYPVEVVARLGGRDIVQPALEQGRADLVPGYLGSALDFLYERRVATTDPRATYRRLKQALAPEASGRWRSPRPRTATASSSPATWPDGVAWSASATYSRSLPSSSSAGRPNAATG